MVSAIEAFVECLMLSSRSKSEGMPARLELLVRELNAIIGEPYDRELFEQILGPLRTLRITSPELEKSRPWLIVLSNIHIARYLSSDLEATDSLDEALDVLSLSRIEFPNDPIAISWYSVLVKHHAKKFLATEEIVIVNRLIKIFSQLQIAPERQSLDHQIPRKELGEVFENVMQRFTTKTADFRDLHRALSIYNEYKSYMAVKDPYMPVLLLCQSSHQSGAWGDADRVFRLMKLAMEEHLPTVKCFMESACVCMKTVFAVQRLRYSHTKDAAVLDDSIATAQNHLAESANNAKARSYIESQLADLLETRGKLKMKDSALKLKKMDRQGAEDDRRRAGRISTKP